GFGYAARKYGMSSDSIISADMVTANGTFLSSINSTNNPDLYFALRGAGNAGYGIITSLTFKIYPIPPIITAINISYVSEQVEFVFKSLEKVAKTLNNNISPYIRIVPKNDRLYICLFYGEFLGSVEEAKSAVKELIELSNPVYTRFVEMSWWDMIKGAPTYDRQPSKSSSYVIGSPGLPLEGINFLRNFIDNVECTTKAIFDLYGGAISRFSVNSSAFIHREALYVLQIAMHVKGYSQEVQANA
ncbi:13195_t:CDS:1, partial [Cetraspora pellucida]